MIIEAKKIFEDKRKNVIKDKLNLSAAARFQESLETAMKNIKNEEYLNSLIRRLQGEFKGPTK